MEKFAYLLVGIILGAASALIGMQDRLQIGRATVMRCRMQVAAIGEWSNEDRAKFWANVRESAYANEQWRIIKAIADIPLDKETP